MQADYLLVTASNPSEITSLSLFLTAQWFGSEPADLLFVFIWNNSGAGAWEQITANISGVVLPGYVFVPDSADEATSAAVP